MKPEQIFFALLFCMRPSLPAAVQSNVRGTPEKLSSNFAKYKFSEI